jgi:hypothetical protein
MMVPCQIQTILWTLSFILTFLPLKGKYAFAAFFSSIFVMIFHYRLILQRSDVLAAGMQASTEVSKSNIPCCAAGARTEPEHLHDARGLTHIVREFCA